MTDTLFTVGLMDSLFGHAKAVGNGDLGVSPTYMFFDRGETWHPVTFFTDRDLDRVSESSSELNVAWIVECKDVEPATYEKIKKPEIYKNFDLVLTHDRDLLAVDNRFIFTAFGGCWIQPSEQKIYPKKESLSIIASAKRDLKGHELRHAIVSNFREKIQGVFGRGYQEVDSKLEGLKDFRYSIAVENIRHDYWFTEKIIDCFATGTVPIYWGCPDIGTIFDPNGIIQFESIDELEEILNSLSADDYEKRMPSVKRNFELFKTYSITEDFIYTELILKHPLFKKYLGVGA